MPGTGGLLLVRLRFSTTEAVPPTLRLCTSSAAPANSEAASHAACFRASSSGTVVLSSLTRSRCQYKEHNQKEHFAGHSPLFSPGRARPPRRPHVLRGVGEPPASGLGARRLSSRQDQRPRLFDAGPERIKGCARNERNFLTTHLATVDGVKCEGRDRGERVRLTYVCIRCRVGRESAAEYRGLFWAFWAEEDRTTCEDYVRLDEMGCEEAL